MYNTTTATATYTVVDIRKTFEGFSADLRMIASRTEKMTGTDVEKYLHDIIALAENKYLKRVDITLLDQNDNPVKASKYTIDENGSATQSDRAGNNEWRNVSNTRLTIIIHYSSSWHELTTEHRDLFRTNNGFEVSWGPSSINTSYSHLSKESAQLYASKGYELRKENYK